MAVNRKFYLDGMFFDLIICKQGDIFFPREHRQATRSGEIRFLC